MKEELWGYLWVANLVEILDRVAIFSAIDLRISCGDPGNGHWLSSRIFRARTHDNFAKPANPFEIQCQGAQPEFAEIEKPRDIPILLAHFPSIPHNFKHLAKLPQTTHRHGPSTKREKVRHQTALLMRLRSAPFEDLEGFTIVALKG